jgi:hypothetical protein
MSVLNKSRTLKPLAFDEKSTFDTFPHQMQYKARLALYCITVLQYLKAEVSKVGFLSKAVSSNVRGVGTFF